MLFLTLIVLLLITALGTSGAQVSVMEEQLTAGSRDRDIAFQAAEAALAQGEDFVEALTNAELAQFDLNTNGLYRPRTGPDEEDWWHVVDWDADPNLPTVGDAVAGVSSQPRYIVEYVRRVLGGGDSFSMGNSGAAAAAPTDIFRITAYGYGGSDRGVVMIQTTVGTVLN